MKTLIGIDAMIARWLSASTAAKLLPWFARALLGLIFVIAGYHKLGDGYGATAAYMNSMGVPEALLPPVILLELGGGLALMAGFQTRLVALLLAAFCLVAAMLFHLDMSQKMQQIMFMKNIAIAGGLLWLAMTGAGPASLDGRCLGSGSACRD